MKSIINEPHILLFGLIFCLLTPYSALIGVEGGDASSGWRLMRRLCTQVRVSKFCLGIQIRIESVPPHQLMVRALFRDHTLIQHEDSINPFKSRNYMRHENHG